MDILQRLQPLDLLFVIMWAAVIGWGLQTGVVRQLGMLVGVYAAALIAGSAYRQGGAALGLAFGRQILPQLEFAAYVLLFVVVFGLIGLLIWRAYPVSRLGRGFGTENVLGAALAAVWGVLFLIALLTMLRFYAVVPWKGEESSQQGIAHQVQLSQVAPVLEVVASPLWQVMTPWFPAPVPPRL
jgi:colicin V production protein